MKNPRVFLDIAVGQRPPERVVFELFANVVRKTAENFRALCTGEMGIGETTGKPLHYKGTSFNNICIGSFAQGGDISGETIGRPGESIYGGYFEDENFQRAFGGLGRLYMANCDPNRNGTQFLVTLKSEPLLAWPQVVFGKVIDGMGTMYNMNELGTLSGQPKELILITDCGEVFQDIPKQPTGLVQTTDSGGIFQGKTNNLMVSHEGKKEKACKRARSSDGKVEELNVERNKRRKSLSSVVTECGESSHDNVMQPDKGEGRSNPRVFLDIAVGQRPPERVVIELFANVVPKTAENFRALCTGEMGIGETTGKPLHYKGTSIHYICKGLFAEGGDISGETIDGESIYGGYFKDENFQLSHNAFGMLSMSSTNGCGFIITLKPMRFFYGLHSFFGKVIEGIGTLYSMDQLGTPGGKPTGLVQITDCGEISQGIPKEPTGLVGEISQDKENKVVVSDEDDFGARKRSKKLKRARYMQALKAVDRMALRRSPRLKKNNSEALTVS